MMNEYIIQYFFLLVPFHCIKLCVLLKRTAKYSLNKPNEHYLPLLPPQGTQAKLVDKIKPSVAKETYFSLELCQ